MLSMLDQLSQCPKTILTSHQRNIAPRCLNNGAGYIWKTRNPSGWQSLHSVLNELVKMRPEERISGCVAAGWSLQT